MTALSFTLVGRPPTWQRTNYANGRHLTDKAMRVAKASIAALALQARQRLKVRGVVWPLDAWYVVDVLGHWPDAREGDGDRMVNLVLDACAADHRGSEGVLWKSDRQVKAHSGLVGVTSPLPCLRVMARVMTVQDRRDRGADLAREMDAVAL